MLPTPDPTLALIPGEREKFVRPFNPVFLRTYLLDRGSEECEVWAERNARILNHLGWLEKITKYCFSVNPENGERTDLWLERDAKRKKVKNRCPMAIKNHHWRAHHFTMHYKFHKHFRSKFLKLYLWNINYFKHSKRENIHHSLLWYLYQGSKLEMDRLQDREIYLALTATSALIWLRHTKS